jgi:hypothetical protein
MAEQIFEDLELLQRELEGPPGPHNLARHEVHRQVVVVQLQDLI